MKKIQLPKLALEQVYDAVFDDEAFDHLPGLLAQAVGARSATLGWRYSNGELSVLNHNHYFRDQDFADYEAHHAFTDPWIAVAYRPQGFHRAICMDDRIDAASIKRTSFYNDWLRGMGDDTLHCLGAATSAADGDGIIGLHRGPSKSGAFTAVEAAHLAEALPHLARVMTLRGRLAAAKRRTHSMEAALDESGLAIIVVDGSGMISVANTAGEALLNEGHLLTRDYGRTLSHSSDITRAVKRATDCAAPSSSAISMTKADGAEITLRIVPYKAPSGRRSAMILSRSPTKPSSRTSALQQLFKMTPAEAQVALLFGEGKSLKHISGARGTSLETVRSQLRSIRGKMSCHRQGELSALINNLPI